MALKLRAELKAENAADLADNAVRAISAADVRGQMDDTADSALFREDIPGLDVSEANVTSSPGAVTKTLALWVEDIGEGGGGGSGGEFDTVATMLASTDDAQGAGTVWRADGFRYREADPAATDHHLTTAGGVKLYVQPTDDGWHNFLAMGPARDGVTDDYPKLRKLLDIRPTPNGDAVSPPTLPLWPLGPSIFFPQGAYFMDPGVNGIQIKAQTHLKGVNSLSVGNVGKYSELRFPPNNLGLCFNWYNMLNGALEATQTGGALGSSVRQLSITGHSNTGIHPSTNSDTAHAIEVHCPMLIDGVQIFNFSGDGLHLTGSAGIDGSINLFTANEVTIYYCRNGVYVDGSDSNAGVFTKINASQCRRWGINDSSFLGNTWLACHCAGNGIALNGGNPADSTSLAFYAPKLNFGETTGTTNGTATMTVSSVAGLQVGMSINIAGVTGAKTIMSLNAVTLTLTLNAAAAAVSSAAITIHSSTCWQPTDAVCFAAGGVPNTQVQAEIDLVTVQPGAMTWVTNKTIAVGDYIVATNLKVYQCAGAGGGTSTVSPTNTSGTSGPLGDGYSWTFLANANPWELYGTGTGTVQWVAGKPAGTYFGGGNYLCDNLNSASIFLGCYAEAGTRGTALRGSSIMMGGSIPSGFIGYVDGNSLLSRGGTYRTIGDLIPLATFGGNDGNILQWGHRDDDNGTNIWRLRRQTSGGTTDWVLDNNAVRQAFKLTGQHTTELMGTGAGIPYQFNLQTLALGVGSFMRRHTTTTSAPISGNYAVGDVIWNTGPGVSGASGWRCTTPGTFGVLNAGATTGSITTGTTTLTVNSGAGLAVGNAITIAGVASTKWVTEVSGTTITIHAAANATVSGAAVAYAVPVITRFGETISQQTIATDAAFTLTPGTSPKFTRHTGTLTADRAVTLSTTNAYEGLEFRITRTGGGAFNLNVGTGPLKALITNRWCSVVYDGTAWNLSAYGEL